MENLLFLGVPILKHIRIIKLQPKQNKQEKKLQNTVCSYNFPTTNGIAVALECSYIRKPANVL